MLLVRVQNSSTAWENSLEIISKDEHMQSFYLSDSTLKQPTEMSTYVEKACIRMFLASVS